VIETPRLILRNWTDQDYDALLAICSDPKVMEYFPATLTAAETKGFLSRLQKSYTEKGYTYFAAEHRESGDVVGFIGLADQKYKSPFTPATDIGWRLLPKYWGKGLATEGAKACLKFAFETAALKEIIAVATVSNLPSIRVMEKIGLKEWGYFDHPALMDHKTLKNCVVYGTRNPVSLS